jgi:hypothetical protein
MTKYECVGRGANGDSCSAILQTDEPKLAGTGWALLYGTHKIRGVEALGGAICSDCLDQAVQQKRDEKKARRRAQYAARKKGTP